MVSVEAIRLENLDKLRDHFLSRMKDYTRSPRITFVDKKSPPEVSPPVPADRYPGLFMGLHYVAGLILVVLLNIASSGRVTRAYLAAASWTFERPWYVAVAVCILFTLFGIVVGLRLIGELFHIAITKAVTLSIRAVDSIDRNTPDGTVGMIGFLLLFMGFALQMYGSYLGRPRS